MGRAERNASWKVGALVVGGALLGAAPLLAGACGGGTPAEDPGSPPSTAEPTATPAGGDTAEATPTGGGETPPAGTGEAQSARAPRPEPITPENADQVREAMLAAAGDIEAFRRLVDPAWGVGTWDPTENGVAHHCDPSRLSTNPQLGFTIGEGDEFRCDRDMRRCSFEDADGRGYVFHFREGDGDAIWLNTIVREARRVRRFDSAEVTAFVGAGEGVCALWARLTGAPSPPDKLAVYVSAATGQVEESVTDQLCGEQAAAAYTQHLAPLMQQGAPDRCERNPTRCVYETGETVVTVYGDGDGPTAVTVERPDMRQALERAQTAEREAFLLRLRRHTCE